MIRRRLQPVRKLAGVLGNRPAARPLQLSDGQQIPGRTAGVPAREPVGDLLERRLELSQQRLRVCAIGRGHRHGLLVPHKQRSIPAVAAPLPGITAGQRTDLGL